MNIYKSNNRRNPLQIKINTECFFKLELIKINMMFSFIQAEKAHPLCKVASQIKTMYEKVKENTSYFLILH